MNAAALKHCKKLFPGVSEQDKLNWMRQLYEKLLQAAPPPKIKEDMVEVFSWHSNKAATEIIQGIDLYQVVDIFLDVAEGRIGQRHL